MKSDSTRLKLAREAWQKARPSEAEVAAGVQRVRRTLPWSQAPRIRRVPSLVVAFTLVFGAALAYAATAAWRSGTEPVTDRSETTETSVTSTAIAPRPAPGLPSPIPGAASAVGPHATAPGSTNAKPSAHTTPSTPATPSTPTALATSHRQSDLDPRASWANVDDALARGAEGEAERALDQLARSPSAADRGKALFGLAQLAASRGDCARARELVTRLAALPEPSELAERGRRLVDGCRSRPAAK